MKNTFLSLLSLSLLLIATPAAAQVEVDISGVKITTSKRMTAASSRKLRRSKLVKSAPIRWLTKAQKIRVLKSSLNITFSDKLLTPFTISGKSFDNKFYSMGIWNAIRVDSRQILGVSGGLFFELRAKKDVSYIFECSVRKTKSGSATINIRDAENKMTYSAAITNSWSNVVFVHRSKDGQTDAFEISSPTAFDFQECNVHPYR
ncbi:MAG: hypothetical protein JKY56_11315 [Kofleriaceae bacterium]|nr:hypothetical protein [Kofleriaceae bacterium]